MRFKSRQMPSKRIIIAQREGLCPETGKVFKAGEEVVYDPLSKLAYHQDSQIANDLRAQQFAQTWNMSDANY